MIPNVKDYIAPFVAIDEPVPYKGLYIYPVLVKDYYTFAMSYDILCIDKDSIPDIEIIQMTYLDFLFNKLLAQTEMLDEDTGMTIGAYHQQKLWLILSLCLKVEFSDIKAHIGDKHVVLEINDVFINDDEFRDICKIILFQNIYDYFDEYIDPEVKKSIDEYYRIKSMGIISPDLEGKESALSAMTGILKKDMLNMTYREFELIYHASLDKLDYQIQKSAELSGMVSFDKPVEHWVYKPKKNRYEDAFTSFDKFKEKII